MFTLSVDLRDPLEFARRCAAAIPGGGVLYYALGGGLGHVTRALSVARRWSTLRAEPFVTLSSCPVELPFSGPHLRLTEKKPAPEQLGRLVAALGSTLRPGVVAVDAFPAGILGELREVLPALPCPRVAILRRLQPEWGEKWRLPELLPAAYSRSVAVEEPLGFEATGAGYAGPVVIRDPDEVLSREAARRALGHADERPLILAVTTGTQPADQGLQGLCVRIAGRIGAAVRLVTPYPPGPLPAPYISHFPLMEWLRAADLVVGPCGYNLFHETRTLGIPAVWVPQPRHYDDQFGRAEGGSVARSPEDLERRVTTVLSREAAVPGPLPYRNGAESLARLLAELAPVC